jgi:hypothetical protein
LKGTAGESPAGGHIGENEMDASEGYCHHKGVFPHGVVRRQQ